jgi:hypothetical protein
MATTGEDGIRTAVAAWLRTAVADAERRGLPELKPLLQGLAESTIALRKADWNDEPAATTAEGGKAEGGAVTGSTREGSLSADAHEGEGGGAAKGDAGR